MAGSRPCLLHPGHPCIPADLDPPEPNVAKYAAQFIRVRALGIAPALVAFVGIAVFRGHKDTRTPLCATAASAACSLTLNLLFLYGGWGARRYTASSLALTHPATYS